MKRKYIVILLLIAVATVGFFSCKNELTIFEQIDQETKLEDAVITGAVNSLVKFNDKLYVSDGNLYTKNESHVRDWSKIGSPAGTIIKLAADSTNLYALTEDKQLYKSSDGNTWTPETCRPTSGKSIKTIFCNGKDTAYLQDSDGKIEKIVTGSTATSDDVPSTVIVVASDKNNTYYADGGTVKGKNGSDLGSVSDLGTVYSLTYSALDKALYAGTSKGLKKLPLDETGKLSGKAENPPGNWGATIKESPAFAVLATGTASSDSALYSSTIATGSANVKVNGLWGYYYSRRDNWNRE